MDNRNKLPYEVFYESDVNGSYLILRLEQEEEIYNYQVEMMMNNDIPSLLDFNLRQKDLHKYLHYNITSKLQLKNLLERRKLKRGELLEILIEILQGILAGCNYLLKYEGYIIDDNYIFLHPENLQVSLLYIPCPTKNTNIRQDLKELVNLLVISVDLDEEASDHFLLKILYELNMETFNLKDFLKFLRKLKSKESRKRIEASISIPQKIEDKENNKLQKSNSKKVFLSSLEQPLTKETGSIVEGTKVGFTAKTKLKILLSEIIIFSIVALIFLETTILQNPTTGKWDGTSMIGVLMLVGAVNFLLFEKIFVKEEVVIKKNQVEKKQGFSSLKIDKREISNIPKEIPFVHKDSLATDSFDTVILNINEARPQLISLQGGMTEGVSIEGSLFIIGKLKEQVDYALFSKTVSRIHAEIRLIDGIYHLKDLNSRNGTYLNGERMNSNIDYPLKNNDKISFADAEYLFFLQENANNPSGKNQ